MTEKKKKKIRATYSFHYPISFLNQMPYFTVGSICEKIIVLLIFLFGLSCWVQNANFIYLKWTTKKKEEKKEKKKNRYEENRYEENRYEEKDMRKIDMRKIDMRKINLMDLEWKSEWNGINVHASFFLSKSTNYLWRQSNLMSFESFKIKASRRLQLLGPVRPQQLHQIRYLHEASISSK